MRQNNNNRKNYNNKNNRNNNYKGGRNQHHGRSYNGDNDNVSPQQKRHAQNQQTKYNDLAKNARQAGDRVEMEYYLQHADHYTRIINLAEEQQRKRDEEKAKQQQEKPSADTTDDAPSDNSDAADETSHTDESQKKPQRKRIVRKARSSVNDAEKDDNKTPTQKEAEVAAKEIEESISDAPKEDVLKEAEEPPKKRRGRPRKTPIASEDSGQHLQAVLPIAKGD